MRFGNVLGSSGSVVPIFRRQIERGGPVTVTDERMTRYFMTIPEAVQLIIRSGSLASARRRSRDGERRQRIRASAGAEVFVLDMGEPVRIVELARAMIELSGLDPERDIDVEIVGSRPGEKLHEELFNSYERARATDAEKILLRRTRAAGESRPSNRCSPRSGCSCSRATPPGWRRRSPSSPGAAGPGGRNGGSGQVPATAEPGEPDSGGTETPDRPRDAPAPLVHSPNS